jgi:hypothetical protein
VTNRVKSYTNDACGSVFFLTEKGERDTRNDREAFLMGKQTKIEDEIRKVNEMLQ